MNSAKRPHPFALTRPLGLRQENPGTSRESWWAQAPRDGWQQTYEKELPRLLTTRYGRTDMLTVGLNMTEDAVTRARRKAREAEAASWL